MPKVTVWIREQDYPTWQDIPNKPEWLHEKLREPSFQRLEQVVDDGVHIATASNLCEHNQPKGGCLVKGCKYARKV